MLAFSLSIMEWDQAFVTPSGYFALTKNLCKYQKPVLVMAAEKDCLFPAKAVLLKAKKVWKQSERYLLKDRGHINELTNEEKKMIIDFSEPTDL